MLNPVDLAAMKQEGVARPGMTVRDFMQKMGIDVDGPIEQLTKFGQKQTQNASALGKMQGMRGGMPPGGMPPGAPSGGPPMGRPPAPPEEPGMNSVLRGMP